MAYKKILTFSFDDGVTQDERFIDILNKYGLKCTFNLNSELLGLDGHLIIDNKKINHTKLPASRVKSIYEGHEVASHTLTHPFLVGMDEESIVYQIEEDIKNLSQLVGYAVRGFAYPGGGVNCSEFVADVIKNKTKAEYGRTTVPTYNFTPQEDLYLFNPTIALLKDKHKLMELCQEFLSSEGDEISLFYIWGHTYELDVNDDWGFFEEFCKIISGKDDVLYCTNTEAFDYIKANS